MLGPAHPSKGAAGVGGRGVGALLFSAVSRIVLMGGWGQRIALMGPDPALGFPLPALRPHPARHRKGRHQHLGVDGEVWLSPQKTPIKHPISLRSRNFWNTNSHNRAAT